MTTLLSLGLWTFFLQQKHKKGLFLLILFLMIGGVLLPCNFKQIFCFGFVVSHKNVANKYMRDTPMELSVITFCGIVRACMLIFYLYLKDQRALKDALQHFLKELISVSRNRVWLDNGSLITRAPPHRATAECFCHKKHYRLLYRKK